MAEVEVTLKTAEPLDLYWAVKSRIRDVSDRRRAANGTGGTG